MGFQISPGVNISEIDLTTVVPSVSTTDGAFAGVFRWGPLEDVTLVSSEDRLAQDFGKPDDDTATSFFTAANFLAYGDKLRLVRVASTASEDFSLTVSTVGTTLTIESGENVEDVLRKGSLIEDGSETKTVVSIDDVAQEAELDSAFTADLVSEVVAATTYVGALNATADGIGLLIKNAIDYDQNHSNGLADVGPFAAKYAGKLGDSIKVSLCPSEAAFSQTLAGTVSSSGTTVTGTGTAFLTVLEVGSLLVDVESGQERVVTAIASDTSCSVDEAFNPELSGATVKANWEYASAIGQSPNTSEFVDDKQGSDDELHVVVIDAKGQFSGIVGSVLERFSFLSKAVDAKTEDGASNYYVNVLNRTSKYVWWTDHIDAGTNWGSEAEDTTFVSPAKPTTVALAGGRDVNTGSAITAAKIKGYDLFADPDIVDVALIMTGEANTAIAIHVINNICEVRKDCVVCISPEQDDVVDNAGSEAEDSIEFRNTLPSSSYAFLDSGWKYQFDKYNDVYRWVPLNGDIAGLMARTDTNNDPWFSPAGFNRGNIKNVIRLAYSPIRAERDDLYVNGINPVVTFQGRGTVLYGDKTLLAKPSAFDRINVRRLFIVIEKAIARASQSSLFEFNDAFTRAQFRSLIDPYLRDVQGRRGIYDFRVVCDSTNNTPEVIDRNEFVGDIYIKPARSINFIQLNFIAVRTGVEFSEIVGSF
jgi:hypothetical protein